MMSDIIPLAPVFDFAIALPRFHWLKRFRGRKYSRKRKQFLERVNSGCCDSWLRTIPGSNLVKAPGQRGLEQQELAHVIHRDHSNQPTGTDHRQRITITVLHSSEDLFNQLSGSCGLEACLHGAADLSLRSLIVLRLLPDLWLGRSSGFT